MLFLIGVVCCGIVMLSVLNGMFGLGFWKLWLGGIRECFIINVDLISLEILVVDLRWFMFGLIDLIKVGLVVFFVLNMVLMVVVLIGLLIGVLVLCVLI